jgi:hypothetical protein
VLDDAHQIGVPLDVRIDVDRRRFRPIGRRLDPGERLGLEIIGPDGVDLMSGLRLPPPVMNAEAVLQVA